MAHSISTNDSNHFSGLIERIYLSSLTPSQNVYRQIDNLEIKVMVNSILQHGLLNPILIRPMLDGTYEIVSGFRRYLACSALGWKKIMCHIVHLNEIQSFEASLTENINRKSLSPLEEGIAFKTYTLQRGYGSATDLANKIGKSTSYVTKRIALLDLPENIQNKIQNNDLKPSLAEELLRIKNSVKQSKLCDIITDNNLSIDNIRKMVKDDPYYCENSEIINVRRELQSFNKAIIALRISFNRISEIMEEEENFLIKELLSHNARIIHNQIDMLLADKKKYAKRVFRYRKILHT